MFNKVVLKKKKLTTDHRKLLYLTFVRSYIGYASEVWAPSIAKNTGTEDEL